MDAIKGVEGNNWIKEKILSGEQFIASKIGAVEKETLASKLYTGAYSQQIRHFASNNAGITPPDDQTLDFFCQQYVIALGAVDIMGSMELDVDREVKLEFDIVRRFCKPDIIFSELRCLEPFYYEDPWSSALEGKNVLVVHPFEESIISQYSKRELLFKNERVLPEFNLITVKAEQTNGGGKEDSKPFIESFHIMANKIQSVDFDIAILGCGAYGLLLAGLVKSIGKQAVHIGGGSQILFGVKGKRWDVHPEISAMYNEHWCRPLDSEKTRNIEVIEGGTYW